MSKTLKRRSEKDEGEHKPLDLDSSRVIRHERMIKKDDITIGLHSVSLRNTMHVLADLYMPENLQRSMMHDDMMVGAFSYSTAVGKLRKDLPDVGMLHPMLVRNSLVIV
ncbi:unnamed protein product [Brassica rapa]|uniref:Uncharacterized protein n=1 Tax=Brassica campestris TaxID=3711 RepID=A0A8D9HLB8_BRACM|nr:unnamed protein product [Brassica rapa]